MTPPPDSPGEGTIEFVSLVAGQQSFCIGITQVREIRRWSPVTMLPHSPPFVLGVINLRGAVIPVIDLAARLGFGRTEPGPRHVVIVVAVGSRTMGLLVELVSEILTVPRDTLRDAFAFQQGGGARFIKGMIAFRDDTLRVLDLQAVAPMLPEEAA